MGDPPTVGVSRSEFTFNEDPSKLDGTAHSLWKGVVPMEMLAKAVEARKLDHATLGIPYSMTFRGFTTVWTRVLEACLPYDLLMLT